MLWGYHVGFCLLQFLEVEIMFTQASEKERTSCLMCGFLLRVGRACRGYDKPLSGKNLPSEVPMWGVLQDTKMGEVIVLSTLPPIP